MNDIYPQSPGFSNTDTSRAAAAHVAPRAASLRRRVWDLLRDRPATGEDLAFMMSANLYSVLPRLSEMQLDGMVRDSGARQKTQNGCYAIVWERTDSPYHDRVKSNVTPKKTIKDWQIEKLVSAVALLQTSSGGAAVSAEKLVQEVIDSVRG